jgi:hypothetical protein
MEWVPFTTPFPLADSARATNYQLGGMRTDIRGLVLDIFHIRIEIILDGAFPLISRSVVRVR